MSIDLQSPLPTYERLPGSKRGVGFRVAGGAMSLWLAKDHLLAVESHYVSEEYKRFEFKNIQAIIVRRTRHGAIVNWVLAGLLSLMGGVWAYFFSAMDFEVMIASGVVSGMVALPLLVLLIHNLIAGPSCICHLRTAVQEVQLPTLNRERSTRKALARLVPVIEAVQGALSQGEQADLSTYVARYQAGLPDQPASR